MAEKRKEMPGYMKFLLGGLSGMGATCIVQPLELVKNRMQLSGVGGKKKEHKTSLHVVRSIIKREGALALYSGLSAGLLRQATYTTTRLGIYTWLFTNYADRTATREPPNFAIKAAFGMVAGAGGGLFGCPAEVALVRMTSDGKLPEAERRKYKSVVDALIRISREEGVAMLWRGAVPTMGRAMVVNAAQLASYSQAKELLLLSGYFKDNMTCHFVSSMISGLITTTVSMPVDIAKTRIQNMKVVDGKPEYSGTADVLKKILRNEGFFAMWKGFTPYYAKLGPHTVLTFIFLEQLNKLCNRYLLGDTTGRGSGL